MVRTKRKKIIIGVVVSLVLLFLFANWFFWFGSYSLYGKLARTQYDTIYSLSSIQDDVYGDYSKRKDYYHHKSMFIFSSDAAVVRVSYTPENYAAQKVSLNEQTYITETGRGLSESEFDIQGWDFRVSATSDPPKELYMIGVNDDKNEIAYVYFADGDLDVIEEPMWIFFATYIKYPFF